MFELPLRVLNQSLYDLERPELAGLFDIVYFAGVLYHLSDPLVAVRILYNRLKLGGLLLVETMCDKDDVDDSVSDPSFESGRVTYHGASAQWNNHYAHSPKALVMLLHDAGFNGITVSPCVENWSGWRVKAIALRGERRPIKRAGLSRQDLC